MRKPALIFIASAVMAALSGTVEAAGFALEHQSVSNLGYAFAGGAASAEDASTIYWNPAGLTRLPGRQLALGLNALYVSARFSDRGTTSPAGPAFPITGGEGGNAIGLNWIPNLYFATDLAPNLKAGVGINSPFGLKTKYPADWMGRYHAIDSVAKSVNVNPAVAWQVHPGVSLGAGVNFQYFDATLSNAIDYGAACFAAFGPAACSSAGIAPQARDGKVEVSGDSWGFGWNAGVLLEVNPDLRLGFAYRSSIEHEIKGRAAFSNPDLGPFAALPAALGAVDSVARLTLDTPDSLSVSLYGQLNPRWAALADVTWTRWSKFKELRVRFDSGAPDSATPQNWDDVIRISLGAAYRLNGQWTLRTGVAYEESAIPDAFRAPRIPDNARTLLAAGFNYKISATSSLDFGYVHAFFKDAPINNSVPGAGTVVGNYKLSADALAIQLIWGF